MTKAEMIAGLQKLYDGFSRSRADLTPERLEALFETIGFHHAEVWGEAVQALLCETRFPDFDTIHEAIDQASEARRLADNAQADAEAKRFLSADVSYGYGTTDHEYGLVRLKVLNAVTDGATPNDVAAMLESQDGRWPRYELRDEAAKYRQMGRWDLAVERPTWWDRQTEMKKAARKREWDMVAAAKGTKAPDETWPGWKEMGYRT